MQQIMIDLGFNDPINITTPQGDPMPSFIGSRIEHPGQTLIVGHGGRLYASHTSIDAWGRTRHTQKITKFRIAMCVYGHSFITHDAQMQRCQACKAQTQQERRARRFTKAKPSSTDCVMCGQTLTAQRQTNRAIALKFDQKSILLF